MYSDLATDDAVAGLLAVFRPCILHSVLDLRPELCHPICCYSAPHRT
jgi:hypothetical protein